MKGVVNLSFYVFVSVVTTLRRADYHRVFNFEDYNVILWILIKLSNEFKFKLRRIEVILRKLTNMLASFVCVKKKSKT